MNEVMQVVNELNRSDNAKSDRRVVDEIIRAFENGRDASWVRCGLRAMRRVAPNLGSFSSDDIWHELERMEILPPEEPRAMAAVFNYAKRHEWVESTMQFVKSTRRTNHGRPVRVWRWIQ